MVRNGTRRCDRCASEMLGRGGADICVICRIAKEEAADTGRQECAVDTLAEVEGFALTAVVGRSYTGIEDARAANDERPSQRMPHRVRHRARVCSFTLPQGMVRFAESLRSISKRRPG